MNISIFLMTCMMIILEEGHQLFKNYTLFLPIEMERFTVMLISSVIVSACIACLVNVTYISFKCKLSGDLIISFSVTLVLSVE